MAALLLLLAGAGSPGGRQLPQASAPPEVISAELPVYPAIFLQAKIAGEVVARLSTDGHRVSQVEVVAASSKFFLHPEFTTAIVKSWRSAPHPMRLPGWHARGRLGVDRRS